MKVVLLLSMAAALILTIGVACSSSEEESPPAAAQTVDLSQFPTPTQSQAEPRPTSPPSVTQSQLNQSEGDTAEPASMTQEEIQQLRQQLQSGQLSDEEAQRVMLRLRAQFGGSQGGPPFEAEAGSVTDGSIESIGEDAITVKAELASVTARVGESTNIRITSVLEPTDLTHGAQVMVVSERVEGNTLARVVTVVPEGQRAFGGGPGGQPRFRGGQGGFGGGQGDVGSRALFGTLENVSDTGFILETQQGPLPVTMDNESVVVRTRQGTLDDLEPGMPVRIVGPADEDGSIDARLITVTPEGLENMRGISGSNNTGARGLGGGN